MKNVYIFLKRAGTRFRFYEKVRKSTKKYEGDLLGLGEAIILQKKNTYLVGPFYKKYIFSGAVLYYFCMRYIFDRYILGAVNQKKKNNNNNNNKIIINHFIILAITNKIRFT